MIFSTAAGNIDILQNDWVGLVPGAFPVAEGTYPTVSQIDSSNHTQLKMSYKDMDGNQQSTWIDTMWLNLVLRPIAPQ